MCHKLLYGNGSSTKGCFHKDLHARCMLLAREGALYLTIANPTCKRIVCLLPPFVFFPEYKIQYPALCCLHFYFPRAVPGNCLFGTVSARLTRFQRQRRPQHTRLFANLLLAPRKKPHLLLEETICQPGTFASRPSSEQILTTTPAPRTESTTLGYPYTIGTCPFRFSAYRETYQQQPCLASNHLAAAHNQIQIRKWD